MANKKSTQKSAKAVKAEKLTFGEVDRSSFALVEIELIKDHGVDKKGGKLKRHPNTADMLIEAKIAKK